MKNNMINRDKATLEFHRRVAYEGTRDRHTLGSRVEFFGIAFSNLREFMQVRYPAIVDGDAENTTPAEIGELVDKAYHYTARLFDAFNNNHHILRTVKSLSHKQKDWAEKHFKKNVFPNLLPITVDTERQPNIHNGLYILVVTRDKDDNESVGYVEIPTGMDRFIQIPGQNFVITIEDLIQSHMDRIFHGRKIITTVPFSILRSAEIYIRSDQYKDPYELIQETLKEREKSWVTQLEVGSKKIAKKIRKLLTLSEHTLIVSNPIIRLSDLRTIPSTIYKPGDLPKRYDPYDTFPQGSIFDYIRQRDHLCFHPFESYDGSVVRFLEEAAEDPAVVSIRITLYRVSSRSRIVDALMKAADNGKLVTVLIELKARFDEKHNIEIAQIMKEGGIRVVYTKPDIKTHAKLCLITRRDNGKAPGEVRLRIYSHIGTGNYSESNSRIYTDYSYFTADDRIGNDLVRFFNLLTSDQADFKSRSIVYAPYNLKSTIIDEITNQIQRVKNKKSGRIVIKCNALTDEGVAGRLIDAAKAGVRVILIVRTACIIPTMKNVEIYSIVGTYLEHSRVYAFGTGNRAHVYIGSADMMTRNLARRNELLIRVENKKLKSRIQKHLKWYLEDNVNRWGFNKNSDMYRIKSGKKSIHDAHRMFRQEAKQIAEG